MQVAIIDIGSNTARLLVADVQPDGTVLELAQEGVHLALGEELARGRALAPEKIEEVAATARRFAEAARHHAVDRVDVIITAPGRGPSGPQLTTAVREATGWPARVLTADDEGRLAYDGAVARGVDLPESSPSSTSGEDRARSSSAHPCSAAPGCARSRRARSI